MSGRTIVTKSRVLWNVPPPWMRDEARALKARCDRLVPSWSLDHCWIAGRGEPLAYSKLQPHWRCLDIVSFFTSIDQDRLWRLIKDAELLADLRRYFRKLGCDSGIPEGCSFTPSLANLFLASVDRSWQLGAVRYGDNIACSRRDRMQHDLAEIGLATRCRETFTNTQVVAGWGQGNRLGSGGDE